MNRQAALAQLKPYFRFPLQDAQARTRFVVGCALLLAGFIVPILPALFVWGYALRIMRATADGEPPSMPAWDDWSSFLSLGFRGGIVGFVFMLPGQAFFFFGVASYFGTFFLLPLAERAGGSEGGALFALFFLAFGVMMLSIIIGSALLLLGTIPLPAALAHFVAKDRLAAAFSVREWWPALWTNALGYFISFVVSAGILAIAYYAFILLYSTFVLVCLGFLLAIPIGVYAAFLGAALFGECYCEGFALAREASA